MNSKTIISALLALSLSTGGIAFAQSYGDRYDRGRDERVQRNDYPDRRYDNGRQWDRRYDDRGRSGYRDGRAYYRDRHDERGAGPYRQFHRGDRLPPEFRHRQYVVNDWRGHHLNPPPRGYHWVQTGADYVLVAMATGIILQLMLHN